MFRDRDVLGLPIGLIFVVNPLAPRRQFPVGLTLPSGRQAGLVVMEGREAWFFDGRGPLCQVIRRFIEAVGEI